MPTMNNYLNLLYVNLGFIAQIAIMIYFRSVADIKKNWSLYRCNPPYWIFSDNISQDFTYCVQNTQTNMMGYLLQPIQYMISSLTSVGGGLNDSINNIRGMFSSIRDFITNIIENVFGVFLNLIIEFQKIIISIKDMVGKMVGIVVTIMYVLDGSIKTMNSAWKGPSGQMVRAIGSCFHPDTTVETVDKRTYLMSDVPLGVKLTGKGGKVFSVLKIDNVKKEAVYKLNNVFVTGDHFVEYKEKWIQVKNHIDAKLTNIVPEYFTCLITDNRIIELNGTTFHDWEDDYLYHQ